VTHLFYEAPHRIVDTLADVETVFGPTQHVVIARELTKLHEEFLRGPVSELRAQLATRPSIRGEIVLMLAPAMAESETAAHRASIAVEVAALIKAAGISEMDALKRIARERGMGKSEAYRELQREQNRLR
jgi:16S rRNA (cytidine1402-2'-O)-methyltransferase